MKKLKHFFIKIFLATHHEVELQGPQSPMPRNKHSINAIDL